MSFSLTSRLVRERRVRARAAREAMGGQAAGESSGGRVGRAETMGLAVSLVSAHKEKVPNHYVKFAE